ncbi:MAG: Dolichyl-phosphate-mannose-protein mannosyltransferase [uncultured archaeon A07HN63]|nr:MAG: Dolichyl-phosphate-mannose-protein mannosyltransferase [uncultured archaeon A07HN63]
MQRHQLPELTQRRFRIATVALAAVAAVVVWTVANQVFPYHSLNHDEGVYLQQAAMLLDGQLSLHPPVDGAFRPWFFVEDGDRLYPKYGPIPAAMFAVGKLAGGYRLALAAIAAGNVALVVGVARELFDRRTALLAGGLVIASPLYLIDSSVFLPYAPTTLWNLLFAYGYLRADRTGDRRWALSPASASLWPSSRGPTPRCCSRCRSSVTRCGRWRVTGGRRSPDRPSSPESD